ncbi:hypothetical protein [Aureicoccus marinus]|jgi:hypothetical protein|uniref:Uncharacterized protein n=1 Tax=Aureicoccus marinus TaxID=754435 RepID=A0A2S7T9L2_9FLAO|nr:hypothetical protein [Aureicoccus marinus]PQJ16619.1 hypothetical protein BST99_13655 [Aureicoccus marinus]
MTELLERAEAYERLKMSHMSTSDRVKASREGKEIVLGINEIYKKTKDGSLMDWMKRVTVKKKKIEKRLNYVPEV